jgi:prepilin-type N-terminal cleavage/methylation domain-containing protein
MRPSERGFTLLEVMVAVAVLGIVVTLITRASVQGMQYAGDARDRLTASLLADRLLADLESEVAQGLVPRLGSREQEEDPFRASVTVSAFDPASVGLDALLAGDERSAALPAVFQTTRGGAPVLTAEVRVAWSDGIHEQHVERTTFLLLPQALPALLELGEPAEGGEGVQEEEPAP